MSRQAMPPGPARLTREAPPLVASALGAIRCLSGCDPGDLVAVARFTTVRPVSAGDVLFSRGQPCSHLFGLLDGAVKLSRTPPAGTETVLDLLAPGALFGERALFSGDGHASRAQALCEGRVLAIAAAPLLRHVQTSPRMAHAVMTHMAERIARLMDRVERQGTYSALQQVAAFLLDRSGSDGVLGIEVERCSRRDLSACLSLRPETLSRALSRLRRDGRLRDLREGGQAVDREALASLLPE